MDPNTFHCRREELARIFGVKQQHISRLVAEGMPRVKHGVYDLPACLQWVTQRIGRLGSLEPDHPGDVGVAGETSTAPKRSTRSCRPSSSRMSCSTRTRFART